MKAQRFALATIVVLTGLVVAAALPGCGVEQRSGSSIHRTSAGITIHPPSGWAYEELQEPGGVAAALQASDLEAPLPNGPRLVGRPGPGTPPDKDSVIRSEAPMESWGSIDVTQRSVNKRPATAVTWTENLGRGQTYEQVVVSLSQGHSITFLLEAQDDQWSKVSPQLNAILDTVELSSL